MNKITKTKRNLVLLLLCVVMVATAVCPVSAKNSSGVVDTGSAASDKYSYMTVSDNFEAVATDGKLALSADFSTGNIALKNTANGYVWYGIPNNTEYDAFSSGEEERFSKSQLIVGIINTDSEAISKNIIYMDSFSATATEVTPIDNGIKVVYTFTVDLSSKELDEDTEATENDETQATEEVVEETTDEPLFVDITVPVTYCLENEKLVANVDIAGIQNTDDVKIINVSVLPYFGAGSWTDDGYIFVPDGSGALIDFNTESGADTKFSQMVYGKDLSLYEKIETAHTETVRMPVFGIANGGDNAILGIITNGAAASSIEAAPANDSRGYNNVYAKLYTRLISEFDLSSVSWSKSVFRASEKSDDLDTFTVEYSILEGDNADYVGMANAYRQYLLDNDMLTKHNATADLNLDVIGAVDVKANFLGFTYNKLTALTTYEQAQQMLEALNEKGIDNVSMRYLGWGNNGLTNGKILSKASTLGVLGGKSKYQSLNAYTSENNIAFYPDADILTFTNGSDSISAKTVFSKTYYKYQYLRSVYAYDLNGIAKRLLMPNKIASTTEKYVKSYSKLGTTGISLSSLTNTVYSSLKPSESYYRTKTVTAAEAALKAAYDSKLDIIGDSANDYSFKYVSKIVNAPTYSSGYKNFSSEIPFYEIVLHGYIPMSGAAMVQSVDSQINYLKCVESGISLSWIGIASEAAELRDTNYDDYYGTTYTLWLDDAAEKYAAYKPLQEKICNSTIVAHTEIADNVSLTEYDNGCKVYVNYSNVDVKCQGVKVAAKSFAYKEG